MPTKRRTRSKPNSGPSLGQLLKGEIAGSVLVLLAILTLLSLLSPSRGELTQAAVDGLRSFFGVGMWLVPLLIGGFGVWLALRDVAAGERWSAWRMIGALGLFLAFEGFAHLVTGLPDVTQPALDGKGGGLTGWLLSGALVGGLGVVVAAVLLLVVLAMSFVALSGRSLADVNAMLAAMWARLLNKPGAAQKGGLSKGPAGARISPPLPLGEPREPNPFVRLWRKIVPEKVRAPRSQPTAG